MLEIRICFTKSMPTKKRSHWTLLYKTRQQSVQLYCMHALWQAPAHVFVRRRNRRLQARQTDKSRVLSNKDVALLLP